MKIYAFEYNPMIEESCYETISLHTTNEGAYRALMKHRQEMADEYNDLLDSMDNFSKKHYSKFGKWQEWRVIEMEVQE